MSKSKFIRIRDKLFISLTPIVIALISVSMLIPKNKIGVEEGIDNCKMMLDIWGVMLGFVITALSILLTIHENRYVKMLIDKKHYSTVLFSYAFCCTYLFIAVIVSIILIYGKIWNNCIYILFKILIVTTITSLGIALFFMFKIIFKGNNWIL